VFEEPAVRPISEAVAPVCTTALALGAENTAPSGIVIFIITSPRVAAAEGKTNRLLVARALAARTGPSKTIPRYDVRPFRPGPAFRKLLLARAGRSGHTVNAVARTSGDSAKKQTVTDTGESAKSLSAGRWRRSVRPT